MLVFGVAFLGFSSTALVVQNIKPIYTAQAQIIFDSLDPVFIGSQKAHMKSSDIALSVILKLKLMNDPAAKNGSRFKEIDIYNTKLPALSGKIIEKDIEPVISRFKKDLSVQKIPDSSVIDLEYRAENPKKAAIILNEVITQYLGSMTPDTTIINNEYETKIFEKLKENAKKAQDNFAVLKSRIGQLQLKNPEPCHSDRPLGSGGIRGNSRSLDFARDDKQKCHKYDKAKARYDSAKAKLKSPPNSRLMRKLEFRYSALKQKLKALSVDYGVKHPDIIYLKAQISSIKKQIRDERENITSRLKVELEQAKKEFQSLKPPSANSNGYYDAFMRKKLKMLQEQAAETQQIFNEYEAIYKKSMDVKEKVKFPAQILSQVSVSSIPTFPNKPKILFIGTIISFIFGLLLAIFVERARNNFLSARQLEEYLNLPCHALIPTVRQDKNKPLARYVVDNPASSTAEAIRALSLVIKLCAESKNREHKVITITSSLPNEGKTTISSWIAQLAAKSGKRVILIDADLRRPSIHKSFGRENTLSLAEYLSGQSKLEEVVDTNDPSGLHIIYGRSVPNSALDLISSDKMEQLLRSLRKAYDLIIIDSPACMAVSDARALEKLSDQLLYAVAWNKTRRQTVHNGISQFTKFGNAQVATVLTNIDLKKHVQLGYGEAINYYGSYK